MSGLIIGGLDLSLTQTGISRVDPITIQTWVHRTGKQRGYPRLNGIVDEVLKFAELCDVVGVEGLITHGKGSSLTDLAGLWWIITRELTNAGITWVAISPPTLKKWATGSGVADKFKMFGAAITRLGAVIDTDDQADALWAAAACAQHYGQPLVPMPKVQVAALYAMTVAKKSRPSHPVIDWPVLPQAEAQMVAAATERN